MTDTFENRLRKARKAKGFTQKSLAKALNISDAAISDWERGISKPRGANLINLGVTLSIDTHSLLNGQSNPSKQELIIEKIMSLPIESQEALFDLLERGKLQPVLAALRASDS